MIALEDYQQLIATCLDEQVKKQKQIDIPAIDLGSLGELEDAPGEREDDLAAACRMLKRPQLFLWLTKS